jgi:hypothetical protein
MFTLPSNHLAYNTDDFSQLDITFTRYKIRTCSFRFRCNAIGRLMYLTESFTWEELPTTDPETGSLTMAGWIPRVQSITRRIIYFIPIFHLSFTVFRAAVSTKRPLSYNTWYPFDTSLSPAYELINITQVNFCYTYSLCLMYDTKYNFRF